MSNSNNYNLSANQQLEGYKKMLLVRKFEERCSQLYGTGAIGGFCHLYIGQEAVVTGATLAKKADDNMITSYRSHAHAILSGIAPKQVMAELCGKYTGCSKGKGGSMHLFNLKGNFYGGHGIVASQVPIGTGLAFAEKYLGTQNVTFVFFGDGAVHQGQVYEAFNMATLWNLPVVYIIENNQYAMGTSVKRSTGETNLYNRGNSFGISGKKVDGMNLQAVYKEFMAAREFVVKEQKPILLEVATYRYRGHSMSDPGNYRSREEIQEYRSHKDPIENLKLQMIKNNIASEEKIQEINEEIKQIIVDAVEFAQSSPQPASSELFTDVYMEE